MYRILFAFRHKITQNLNNIGALLKDVLFDLRARENLFVCTLRACSSPRMQFAEPCIPSKKLRYFNIPENVESIFAHISLFKPEWLVCGCYHSPSQDNQYFFNRLGNVLDKYTQNYDRFSLIGDFNVKILNHVYQTFFMITMQKI